MKLKEGDVIKLQKGICVYADIPEKFVYPNRRTSSKLSRCEVKIGTVWENDTDLDWKRKRDDITEKILYYFSWHEVKVDESKVVDFVKEIADPQQKERQLKKERLELNEGEFVVTKTTVDGGGGDYPNGHHVFCKALKNGEYDPDAIEVSFYQSGHFTCMITDISPVREMKMKFV